MVCGDYRGGLDYCHDYQGGVEVKSMYKIVEWKDDHPHTLFHGVGGSRRLPVGQWLEAEQKPVVDGSGQDEYRSGFHVFYTWGEAESYLSNFRVEKDRRVIPVRVAGEMWKKPTNDDILLVSKIYIPPKLGG